MKKILILALGLSLFLSCLSVIGIAQNYNRYQLQVKLHPEEHVLEGSVKATYINTSDQPLNSVYFLLFPNYGREKNPYIDESLIDQNYVNGFDPSWLKIKSVTSDKKEFTYKLREAPPYLQTYSLEDVLMEIRFPEELKPDEKVTLDIKFVTKFPWMLTGDQSHNQGVYTWRFGWHPILVPDDNLVDGKYISKGKPYYKYELPAALYQLKLTVPDDFQVVLGACEQEMVKESGGWKTYQMACENPARTVALHLGKELVKFSLKGPVTIDVYYRKGHDEEARLFATYVQDILDYYQARYGDYGRKRLVLAEANASGFFGLAADGIVLLGSSFFSDKDLTVPDLLNRFTEYVLAHELAHQWWGIGVGTDFNAENYISEAFAQYLSITYFEDKYGEFKPNLFQLERKGLLEKIVENQLGFYNLREHMVELPYLQVFKDDFDEAIVKPLKDVKYGNYTYTRIYNKGYLVLRSLEGLAGRATMENILTRAYQEYKYKIITTEKFKKLAEEVSEMDLSSFFEQTLYAENYADYGIKKVKVEKKEDGYINKIHLTHKGHIVQPVKLIAVTEDGQEIEKTWKGESSTEIMTLKTETPVEKVHLDPESMVLDVNRLNNNYPPKLKVITTGKNALPLDAYLIRFDPLSQTVQGGYLWHRWLIGNNLAAFTQYLGRGSAITGLVAIASGQVLGEVSLNLTEYSHPETGSPAKYWEASEEYNLSFTRDLTTDQEILNYIGLNYKLQEKVTDYNLTQIDLVMNPFKFSRISLSGFDRARILPNVYVDSVVKAGASTGHLPQKMKFTLHELKSFGQWKNKWEWEPKHFPGNAKLFGKVAINFPLKRDLEYYVANLAKIDRIEDSFFIQAGTTSDSLQALDFKDSKGEVGTEINFTGSTLGGLFPVNLTIGYTYPLWGKVDQSDFGHLYVGLGMSIF